MPLYRYQGTDRAGNPTEGTISAPSSDQATYLLGERGYQITTLTLAARLTQPGPAPITAAPQIAPPKTTAQPAQPVVHRSPSTTPRPSPGQIYRTKPARDKDRFFLFAQMAEQVRGGISPADSCNNLATYQPNPDMKRALQVMAKATTEGGTLSDVMAMYPDLFPESSVGMVRAGEYGGFLPDALLEVSDQAGRAHKFKRWFWFVWFVGINALLSIPVVILMTRAMLATWDKMDPARGGNAEYGEALRSSYWQAILWPWGPLLIFAVAVTFYLRHWLSSSKVRKFRHALGLKWPVLGQRAKHENVTSFAWVLGRLSRAGLPPNMAWNLAADAVPNLVMRERLLEVGSNMRDGTKLSQAATQAGVLPYEYVAMIQTGELTGDVPGTMQRIAEMAHADYEAAQNYAKLRGGCWGLLGCFVTSGIVAAIFFYFWYHELIEHVLYGLEPQGP